MAIIYRLVKGSPLTFAEEDGNFSDLDGRVVALENFSAANPIDAITIAGNQLTTAAGGGSDTVTVPTAEWNGRGDWTPLTVYAVNDLVVSSGNLYLVKIAHTSEATFDSGFQIGGNDVYDFILGPVGQTKSVPLAASTYTLQGTDNLKYYRCSASCTVTIPASADVFLPLDSEVTFRQGGSSLSFATAAGVTLNAPDNSEPSTSNVGAVVTIKKVGTDSWDIFGGLTLFTA
jgi:hypothetical protein